MMKIGTWILLATVALSLSGCGTSNLFSSLSGTSTLDTSASAQNALDNGDFAKAKAEAAKLVSSSDADAQKIGHIVSAEATFGEQGVSVTKIVSSLEAVTKSGASDLASLQKVVPSNVNATAVAGAAYEILDTGTTDKDKKTTAGIAAGIAAAVIVTNKFDYNGDGVVDDKDFATSVTNTSTGQTTTVTAAKVTADWIAINNPSGSGTLEASSKGSVSDLISKALTNAGDTLGGDSKDNLTTVDSSIKDINSQIAAGTLTPTTISALLSKKK